MRLGEMRWSRRTRGFGSIFNTYSFSSTTTKHITSRVHSVSREESESEGTKRLKKMEKDLCFI
jgi:hypothetical protein